ncbi:hypothetical protein B0H65DRAFT_340464 [Neurospora tetraspora]|uniref:Uncharacterized protein n=1 Tax=Neurospora tetraspora TaxID=94610 RepID=A0AAE0MKI0_9PEZI|nr:hypothetical protein B0H65DRAFT_340464 [Neurospora tetraspora]
MSMLRRLTGLVPTPRVGQALVGYLTMISLAAGQTTTFPPDFEGIYFFENQDTTTLTCGTGSTFTIWRDSIAACCPISFANCDFPTKCVGDTLYHRFGTTERCPSDYPNCATMTIFDKFPQASNYWFEVGCGPTDYAIHSIYREIATSTSTSSTSQASRTSQPPTPASTASTTEPSITSSAATASTGTSDSKTSSSSQSKAWIAGPIAGGVAVLLLLGAFLWWWLRKNKKNKTKSLEQNNANNENTAPSAPVAQTGYEGGYMPGPGYMGQPPPQGYTPHTQSPPNQYSPYYPPSSPPQYHNPHHSMLSGTGTASIMSGWQGQGASPRPVSELHSENATMKYQHDAPIISEVPATEQRPAGGQGKQGHGVIVEAP